MSFSTLLALLLVSAMGEQRPAPGLYGDLKAKRDRLPSFHQEFEASWTAKRASGSQTSKWKIVLDMSKERWREKRISGAGRYLRIFDGKDTLWMEEGGSEYERTKNPSKEEDRAPSPYRWSNVDWSKAVETGRRPCGIPGRDHECVVVNVPLKQWSRLTSFQDRTTMLEGAGQMIFDIETGLLMASRFAELIQGHDRSYQRETAYVLKSLRYGTSTDESFFQLPAANMREVKELPHWDAARIRKELAGKQAPELTAADLQGNAVSLAALKGKTVLLDFWTTWCPPCQADGPALEKLYRKYRDRDLVIVGLAVDEERDVVEKFLKEHPHTYPIVLTAEHEMPRAYQVYALPTYIVIDSTGSVTTAVDGDKGFGDLRKLLKKAGLDAE